MSVLVFQMLQSYNLAAFRQPFRQIFRLAGGWAFVFLIVFAALFFLKLEGAVSRVWVGELVLTGIAALGVERAILARIALSAWPNAGRLARRAVVVGGGEFGQTLLRDFGAAQATPTSACSACSTTAATIARRRPSRAFPKLGNVDDLVEFARHTRIDLVIFALPITAEQRILQMLRKLWVLPIDIRLAAHANRLRFRPRSYSYVGQVPVLDLFDKPIADWDVVIKLAFDKIVGGARADRALACPAGDRASPSSSIRRGPSSSASTATASTTN